MRLTDPHATMALVLVAAALAGCAAPPAERCSLEARPEAPPPGTPSINLSEDFVARFPSLNRTMTDPEHRPSEVTCAEGSEVMDALAKEGARVRDLGVPARDTHASFRNVSYHVVLGKLVA